MKRLTHNLLVAIFTLSSGIIFSSWWLARPAAPVVQNEQKPPAQAHLPIERSQSPTEQEQSLTEKNVTFSYDRKLFFSTKGEVFDANPLENATDKPDGVRPRQARFRFTGQYAEKHGNKFYEPEICVTSIANYKQAYAINPDSVKFIDQQLDQLRQLIAQRQISWKDEIQLPQFADISQDFRARVKHIKFKNGRGVMYLAQYNTEVSLINNEGLVYIFQGLTDDNVNYVTATFPVITTQSLSLPPDYGATTYQKYDVSDFGGEDGQKKYQKYLEEMAQGIEKLPANEFYPNLKSFEYLIGTLSVRGQN